MDIDWEALIMSIIMTSAALFYGLAFILYTMIENGTIT